MTAFTTVSSEVRQHRRHRSSCATVSRMLFFVPPVIQSCRTKDPNRHARLVVSRRMFYEQSVRGYLLYPWVVVRIFFLCVLFTSSG